MRAHIIAAKREADKLTKAGDSFFVRVWLRGGGRIAGDLEEFSTSVLVLDPVDFPENEIRGPGTGDIFVDFDDIAAIQIAKV